MANVNEIISKLTITTPKDETYSKDGLSDFDSEDSSSDIRTIVRTNRVRTRTKQSTNNSYT